MSHYKSITITHKNKIYNIRSVVGGKQLTNQQAVDRAIKTKTLGKSFHSIDSAVKAAKALSKTQTMPKK